jgi:hypothetical protein
VSSVVEQSEVFAADRVGIAAGHRFPPFRPRFLVPLIRPEDFLYLELEFRHLRLVTGKNPRLQRIDRTQPAYLIAYFPPQHIAEEAFYERDPTVTHDANLDPQNNHPDPPASDLLATPPIRARIAGWSRLVFCMPDERASIEYTSTALLDAFRTWPLNLAPGALPNPPPSKARRVGPHPQLAPMSDEVLTGLATSLMNETAVAVGRLIQQTVAERAKKALGKAARDAGVGDAFDLDRMVDESVHEVSRSLDQLVGDAVASLDARRLQSLIERTAGAVVAEMSGRLAPIEKNAGVSIDLTGIIGWLLRPVEPAEVQTAIELPWRLLLSPNRFATWAHALAPVIRSGRTELWHTRLAIRDETSGKVTEEPHEQRTLRAIWSPDYGSWRALKHTKWPFDPNRPTLSARDRQMLVQVTAGFDIDDWTPLPSIARQLMLSSAGGWLETEGSWTTPALSGIELEAWKHRAAMGRDSYVRVVYAGFLFPFGHRASLVKVSERKFEGESASQIAYLRQRYFIVVREPVRRFPGPGQKFLGRQFPFTQVRITTTETPNLEEPGSASAPPGSDDGLGSVRSTWGASDQGLFWPFFGEQPFEFGLVARDGVGEDLDFSAPLIFVSRENNLPFRDDVIADVIAAYAKAGERIQRSFGGRSVRFAESTTPGDTDLETVDVSFGGQQPASTPPSGAPHFYPTLEQASVRVPSMKRLLGSKTDLAVRFPGAATPESVADHQYLKAGLGSANPGQVFLEAVPGREVPLAFGSGGNGAKSGGVISPDLSVRGLSRTLGPVGGADIAKAAKAEFDPLDFFPDATLLGGIKLHDVVAKVTGFDAKPPEVVPRLTFTDESGTATTRYHWQTSGLAEDPLGLFQPHAGAASTLSIDSTITATDAGAASADTTASLTNFKINLYGFLILWFDEVKFHAPPGRKPEPIITMHNPGPVSFGGPLEFVNELRKFIPSDGFSDPPDVQVTPSGLSAGFSLGLPPIAVGIFSLQNVKLGASFLLPFDSSPAVVRFNFAERHDTFVLTVSAFGGGGFFAIAVNSDGVQELEAALEFTGSLALNVGVASGGVYVKAGIYYHWQADNAELTGYVEVGGSLSVIGLITVSLVFNMSLTYTTAGKVWGQATLIVEVEVLCFSTDVSVTVERQFKGSAGDPSFGELYAPQQWASYCAAFAEE